MIPDRISGERLAASLAALLDRVVPRGISVRAHGPAVGVYDPAWWGDSVLSDIVAEDGEASVGELLESATWVIMSSTLDKVMEITTEQWPMGSGGAADPHARIVGDQLHMWFGHEAAPVLRLEPLDLTALVRHSGLRP